MKKKLQWAQELRFNSVMYRVPADVSNHNILFESKQTLILGSLTDGQLTIDWGTNSKTDFFSYLDKTLAYIGKQNHIKKLFIEWIPENFINEMEKRGFIIVNEWIDYWLNTLTTCNEKTSNFAVVREMEFTDYEVASEITQACRYFSRGYEGESIKWFKEWLSLDHTTVILAEIEKEIVGVCCLQLYDFNSEKGPVMWVRELAVRPEYHNRKIGYTLMTAAVNWGIEKGAVRSFLACDTENSPAIKLYERLGFQRQSGRGQINMCKSLRIIE